MCNASYARTQFASVDITAIPAPTAPTQSHNHANTGHQAFLAALTRYVKGAVASLSMVDYPFPWTLVTALPARPVRVACAMLAPANATIEQQMAALNRVVDLYAGQPAACKNVSRELFDFPPVDVAHRPNGVADTDGLDMILWNYQACTELPMMPLSTDYLGFFPPENSPQLQSLSRACAARYGVTPRPDYLPITYGGHPITQHWSRLVSHVVVVDGALDTWRTGSLNFESGIRNRSDLVVIPPVRGAAHHQDLIAEHPQDTPELVRARQLILATLRRWLLEDA